MLFSIGNLITLVIVLVLFFVYHQLTANNRSLEKVKKLSEKLQNDLKEFVSVRAEELQHYGIDLDVQQKAAKIALERLQAAQEAVAEKSAAVGDIANRFKEYDDVLTKLMEMTARVDENLARIHEDETFAEGVNRKLDLAKKSIVAIERELPLLRESFAQSAQTTMDSFKDSLMSEIKEDLFAVRAELTEATDTARGALTEAQSVHAAIDEELQRALAVATERARSVEDEAFLSLKTHFNGLLDEYRSGLEQTFAQAAQDTAKQAKELKGTFLEFRESWNTEASAKLKEFESKAGAITKLLETSLNEAKTAVSGLSANLDKAGAEVERLTAGFSDKEKALADSLLATKDKIEEEFAAFGQAFEDHRTRFEANFTAETASLSESLESLARDVAKLKTDAYNQAENKLTAFNEDLNAELEERKAATYKKLDLWLSDLEKTLSGVSSEAASRSEGAGRKA